MRGFRRLLRGGRRRGMGQGGMASGGAGGTFPVDEADRAAIAQLGSQGIDLSKPVRVRHTIAFATSEAAGDAANRLRARGFDVEVTPGAAGGGPTLNARNTATLTPEALAEAKGRLTKFAKHHGGVYEGWQAEPSA